MFVLISLNVCQNSTKKSNGSIVWLGERFKVDIRTFDHILSACMLSARLNKIDVRTDSEDFISVRCKYLLS